MRLDVARMWKLLRVLKGSENFDAGRSKKSYAIIKVSKNFKENSVFKV